MENKNNCACASCADGSTEHKYDPVQVGSFINKYIFGGSNDTETIKAAYPKAMVYLESEGLAPTEENIKAHAEKIKAAIKDPNFLKGANNQAATSIAAKKKVYKMVLGAVVIGIVIYLIWRSRQNA